MRFEQPEYAKQVHERQELGNGGRCGASGGGGDIEEAATFCIPAEGVHCRGCKWDPERKLCFKNDCPALFTPAHLRQQQRWWATDPHPQLIITAGPERSGSTWLYNAVRLLFQHACKPLDAYWLKDITDAELDARGVGVPGAHHVLIKTHAWSDAFNLGRATHVFVTHRDLRQVLASYRRMSWEYSLPESYVDHHFRWKDVAELDIGFEDIIARPEALLRDLASRLGLEQVDVKAVLHDVSTLPVPKEWVDPVTQIWPSHISDPYNEARKRATAVADASATPPTNGHAAAGGSKVAGKVGGSAEEGSLQEAMGEAMQPPTPSARAQLDREAAEELVRRFPHFFKHYGYA